MKHTKQSGCDGCRSGDHILHRKYRQRDAPYIDEMIAVRAPGKRGREGVVDYVWLGRSGTCVGVLHGAATLKQLAKALALGAPL